jgi:hypothetical protein
MMFTTHEERRNAAFDADVERDKLIRDVLAEYQVGVVFERSSPAPPNAKYDVRNLQTGEMFIVHDHRTVPCGPSLADDIRMQLKAKNIDKRP